MLLFLRRWVVLLRSCNGDRRSFRLHSGEKAKNGLTKSSRHCAGSYPLAFGKRLRRGADRFAISPEAAANLSSYYVSGRVFGNSKGTRALSELC